jgi:nucleoid DNA-binding protein
MWMLVILVYASALSNGDSVAITNVGSFQTEQDCIVAGDKVKKMQTGAFKSIRYTCVKL